MRRRRLGPVPAGMYRSDDGSLRFYPVDDRGDWRCVGSGVGSHISGGGFCVVCHRPVSYLDENGVPYPRTEEEDRAYAAHLEDLAGPPVRSMPLLLGVKRRGESNEWEASVSFGEWRLWGATIMGVADRQRALDVAGERFARDFRNRGREA